MIDDVTTATYRRPRNARIQCRTCEREEVGVVECIYSAAAGGQR